MSDEALFWRMEAERHARPVMVQCERCGCWTRASVGHCRWCKPAPDVSMALAEHTAAALDKLLP